MRGIFSEADEPWMPRLIEIEHRKNSEDPEEAAYYSKFGWSQIVKDAGRFPHIDGRWEQLQARFNQHYYYRMIGIETMEHWQNNLQERFDSLAPTFEYAYSLYEQYADELKEDLIEGEKEKLNDSNVAGGSDSSESENRSWDTPDAAINQNADYADSVGKGSGKTIYGRTDTRTITRSRELTGSQLLRNIMENIRSYRDIDTWFVESFEPLFMSVYWY